ncbi:recombinase family protein [Acinetobacter venetianus]|uniref:recombinase family protein n=1 Tax=Acinetobacter venetianus TaxID=52133 RepID=UPI0021505C0F|nr:recombinase family protein [Acinetobacter venetianus]MCR4532677.1 recombinase family protein [Acinetobacter venetianus]
MRIYGYVRVDPTQNLDEKSFISFFYNCGFTIKKNRLILEEVFVDKSLIYRDKLHNLIDYSLEDGDLLIIKSIDCLGCNFSEITEISNKIFQKKIRLICLDYSKNELSGDLRTFYLHFLKICCDFEKQFDFSNHINKKTAKKVGRPEILSNEQKKQVIDMFKKGWTIYSLAKHFSVTRTVIQRVIRNSRNVDCN